MPNPLPVPAEQTAADPLESPELLMINALLEAPEGFRPDKYGVDKTMLVAYQKPWEFCLQHQRSEGRPPSLALFCRTFPDFEILTGVSPKWAADKLRTSHRDRTMRKEVKQALNLLNLGEVDEAQDILRGITKNAPGGQVVGTSVFDPITVEDHRHKIAYPTPWEYLNHLTNGGVGLGEFWIFGARLGQGKSHVLPCNAVSLAEAGARVAAVTLEMPKRTYVRRIHKVMARDSKTLQARLRDKDREVRLEALKELPKLPGKIDMFDPSDMKMDTRAIRSLAGDYQYILVDHLGLLMSSDGTPAIKDWRVAAEISNEIKRITLEEHCGLIGAAQINREGEAKGYLPPRMSELSGTDAIGQDVDVAILMRRMGVSSMLMDVSKNRDAYEGRFYITFEPATGLFHEISKDTALDRARADEDRRADI